LANLIRNTYVELCASTIISNRRKAVPIRRKLPTDLTISFSMIAITGESAYNLAVTRSTATGRPPSCPYINRFSCLSHRRASFVVVPSVALITRSSRCLESCEISTPLSFSSGRLKGRSELVSSRLQLDPDKRHSWYSRCDEGIKRDRRRLGKKSRACVFGRVLALDIVPAA